MPSPARYYQCFEFMFILSKGKPKTFNALKDRKNRYPYRWGSGRTVRNKDGELERRKDYHGEPYGRRFNIWEYSTGHGYSTKDVISFEHPATFPEKLAQDHIYSWSNEGDLVYDPFGGSGTTAKMAHLMKRRWIMSEMSEEYVTIAKKRLEGYLKQQILL